MTKDMRVPDLSFYCPFCKWQEKSKMQLAKHMVDEHPDFFQQVYNGVWL